MHSILLNAVFAAVLPAASTIQPHHSEDWEDCPPEFSRVLRGKS